jgi:hypothetical protein
MGCTKKPEFYTGIEFEFPRGLWRGSSEPGGLHPHEDEGRKYIHKNGGIGGQVAGKRILQCLLPKYSRHIG